MNVDETDGYPHLGSQVKLIQEVAGRGLPVLGICLGSQLLARALGAGVHKAPEGEIGWAEVELTDKGRADSIFKGLPDPLPVFQWHEDTFDLPSGSTRLASSMVCQNQAFRFGPRAYAFQFHFEVTQEMALEWAGQYASESDRSNPDWRQRLLAGFEDMEGVRERCERIVGNLIDPF